jgi:hypothetical protein
VLRLFSLLGLFLLLGGLEMLGARGWFLRCWVKIGMEFV